MANVNTRAHALARDGFVCQFYGKIVFLAQAIRVLDWHVPDLDLWDAHGRREPLRSRWATVDHLVPEIEGGMDVLDNLVACCVTCNSRKGGSKTEAPRERRMITGWDGLSALFLGLAPSYADRLTTEDRKWQAALTREGIEPRPNQIRAVGDWLRAALRPERSTSWMRCFPAFSTSPPTEHDRWRAKTNGGAPTASPATLAPDTNLQIT